MWKISTNVIGDEYKYQVFRRIDENGIDHSGNREIYDIYDTPEEAQSVADRLNNNMED